MAMPIRLLHNPRCSKSRQALALLRAHGVEPEVVEYLKQPLSAAEIRSPADNAWHGAAAIDPSWRGGLQGTWPQ